MKTIVPLAGPDFYSERYGTKPLSKVRGKPLLETALFGRPWFRQDLNPRDLIFVLRETVATGAFLGYLGERFPGHQRVVISDLSGGAMLSALAAASLVRDETEVLAIDLVDVLFDGAVDPLALFSADAAVAGIVPYFESSDAAFSYLRMADDGQVLETAEKRVISNRASAGVYFFRNLPLFLDACAGSCRDAESLRYRGNLFVCPSYNALVSGGRKVIGVPVTGVEALSKQFH